MAVFKVLDSKLQSIGNELKQTQDDNALESLNSSTPKSSNRNYSKAISLVGKKAGKVSKELIYQLGWGGINLGKLPISVFSSSVNDSAMIYKKAEGKVNKGRKLANQAANLAKQTEHLINTSNSFETKEKLKQIMSELFKTSTEIIGASKQVKSSLHNSSVVKWKANQVHKKSMAAVNSVIDSAAAVQAKHEMATHNKVIRNEEQTDVIVKPKTLSELAAIQLVNSFARQETEQAENDYNLDLSEIKAELSNIESQFEIIKEEKVNELKQQVQEAIAASRKRPDDFPFLP